MLTRFKLLLLITVVLLATTAIAQSEPAAPSPAPAPEVAAPASPAAPTAPAAKGAKPATPVPSSAPALATAPKPPVPPEPPRHFQLEYVLKEVENSKVVNSRTYSIVVTANGRNGVIRTGSRVPVNTAPASALSAAQYQYMDVGVDIDTRDIRESQGQLLLHIVAEVSSLGEKAESAPPLVRRNRWESDVTIPVGKTATVFSSDDVASTRTMQLDLKASPIK